MIRFDLICANDHPFDSWFASNDAFEALRKAGHLSCTTCGTSDIRKSLMAPGVRTEKAATPADLIAKMKQDVESNADYVGLSFATEARAMHDGDMPERPIYGEASGADAQKLLADGIPVLPLPFIPSKKTN